MVKRKLLLALLAPSLLVGGCNAVFGIGDLDVQTDDAGDGGGVRDAQPQQDATTPHDASSDATTTADAGDATGDAQTSADAKAGEEAGAYCATFGAGAVLCDDYDETDAGQDTPQGVVSIDPQGQGAVVIVSDAQAPPSPPNVLAATSDPTTSLATGHALQQYDPDAGSPTKVRVELQFYLDEDLPLGALYVVPVTINLVGTGHDRPYNIELAINSSSVALLTLQAQATSLDPQNSYWSHDGGVTPRQWHDAVLLLMLDQTDSGAPSSVEATLTIDGIGATEVTNAQIGMYGGYGPPEILVGSTFSPVDSGTQTVFIDNLLVTLPE